MQKLEIVLGAQDNWPIQCINRDGTTPQAGDFLAADALTCNVWAGQDQAVLFSPLVVWYTPAGYDSGLVFLTVTASQSSLLSPNETYQCQIFVTRGTGDPVCIAWVTLQCLPAAGLATAIVNTYATEADLAFFAPWLDEVTEASSDLAGWYNYLLYGRQWLDRCIVNSIRPSQYIFKITNPLVPWGPVEAPNWIIEGYLAADYLIVEPETREIVARKALAAIAEKMISYKPDDPWPGRRRHQMLSVNNLVASYRFKLNISSAPNVTVTDTAPGGGGGATALAVIADGIVTAVQPRALGSGYQTPIVTLWGGSGRGATAAAITSGGLVIGYTVTNPGSGFYQKTSADISDNLGRHSIR
jgi:hypothetical protein